MTLNGSRVMRLRAIADADPNALILILQHLRRCTIAPRSVWAQRRPGGFVEIKVELDALPDEVFHRLVTDIEQMPLVITAVPFDIEWIHA